MSENDLSQLKSTTLVSLIVHGVNPLGEQLSKLLTQQGSKVIFVDNFTKENKDYVKRLKKESKIDFIEFEGLPSLSENLSKLDYVFYLRSDLDEQASDFDSKAFLQESSNLEETLKLASKHQAKTAVMTSIQLNRNLSRLNSTATADPQPYSPTELQKYFETLTAEYYDKHSLDARIIRLGALLGRDHNGTGDKTVRRLFTEAVNSEALKIYGDGLDTHFILGEDDAAYGILKLMFNKATAGEVISLAYPQTLTTLSVAYKLVELQVEATRIQFEESPNPDELVSLTHYTPAPNAEKFEWKAKHSIEHVFIDTLTFLYKSQKKGWSIEKDTIQKIKSEDDRKKVVSTVKTPLGQSLDKIFAPFVNFFARIGGKKKMTKSPNDTEEKAPKKPFNFVNASIFVIVTILLTLLSYFVLVPVGRLGWHSYQAYVEVNSAYENLQGFALNESRKDLESIVRRSSIIRESVGDLEWIFDLTGQKELHTNIERLAVAGEYAALGSESMTGAMIPLEDYFNEFEPAITFSDGETKTTREYSEYLEEIRKNRPQISVATRSLELATDQIDLVDTSVFPTQVQNYIIRVKDMNEISKDLIKPFENTIKFLPELLGVDGRQRYLVLLQNPSEIRSTGGWLSSYVIIGIEGGQIRQILVDDIYNIEGILNIQDKEYPAPDDMQQALDIDDWSMSLSNWRPDFPTAAKDAEFFIKEAGKATKIDGAIAIDTDVVKSLLEIYGPITITADSSTVDAENFNSKLVEIHRGFVPGSTRKSTFIQELAENLVKKIFSEKALYSEAASKLYSNLNKKHILVSLELPEANKYISSKGWDGKLADRYMSAPIPVHWNWGANKANLFLEISEEVTIRILDEEHMKIEYDTSVKNSSTENFYPEGDYKNYMRVLLPSIAETEKIDGFKDDSLTKGSYDRFAQLGGWFEVPTQSVEKLEVDYNYYMDNNAYYPIKVDGDSIKMDLSFYKQPGLTPSSMKLTVEYPDEWAIVEDGDLKRMESYLEYEFEHDKDFERTLLWEYK